MFAQGASLTAQAHKVAATKARLSERYGNLPLSFEVNRGQSDPTVKFLSRGNGYGFFLTSNEAVFVLSQLDADGTQEQARAAGTAVGAGHGKRAVVRMTMVNGSPRPQAAGHDELPGKSNYFIGNDPAKWHTNVTQYAKVAYENVYPGVDLVYYGDQRQLEYDFVVAPGADPGVVTLAFEGARDVHIDASGELVLGVDGGELRQHKPRVYQEVSGVRQEVAGRYVMKGTRQVGFQVAAYDPSRPLIIDPVLAYSTYLGGTSADNAYGIAVDGAGSAYVTGLSDNYPTTPGAAQPANAGSVDAFVTKLDPTGSAVIYSTYLGGSIFDLAFGIAVDGAGSAYVTGYTFSSNFPTTPGAARTTNAGFIDAFVTKLNATGSALVYSTYLGGSGLDDGRRIAVDGAGCAYVAGQTASANFPTTPSAFQTTYAGGFDAYVTKLNATGTALVYSTYLGGSSGDFARDIAVDGAGGAYVTGLTSSTNFPTTLGAAQTTITGFDAFVTKLDATGSALVYSTYLGGSSNDFGYGVAADSAGNAYVMGQTSSTDFPSTPGAAQATNAGSPDTFVTKLDATGSALVYSTYLGGSSSESASGIAVDGAGSAYVTGQTSSADFPTTPGAAQTIYGSGADAFVTKLDATGSALLYSTYLGGSSSDFSSGIAVDAAGNAYVVGYTSSTNFPTTPGAVQTNSAGSVDAFVSRIEFVHPPALLTLSPAAATNPVNTQHRVTATVRDAFGNPTPDIIVRFSVTGTITAGGSATTDSGGQASFCYTGPSAAGTDTITAFADTNNSGTRDAGEPLGAAAKTWFVPLPVSKDQCKNGGWQTFGVFKNQGDCVSFVATKGKNPPSPH